MAYDAELEKRIDAVATELGMGFRKKKMFGGLAYFAKGGNMAFAIRADELLLRVHDGESDDLLSKAGVHTAVMGGRVMQNWLQAGGEAIAEADNLQELMTIGYDYARSLPPKR
jgi:TfoX N-terminal domain